MARALDCYVKANSWHKAIQLCIEDASLADKMESIIKPALLVACDLKSNQIKQTIETFGKRVLRLKIVQHSKKNMPGANAFGAERNFELDSDALSMSNASQSAYSASGRSASQSCGFSETSKKSRRVQNQ